MCMWPMPQAAKDAGADQKEIYDDVSALCKT